MKRLTFYLGGGCIGAFGSAFGATWWAVLLVAAAWGWLYWRSAT